MSNSEIDKSEAWYVVKQPSGQCTIAPADQLEPLPHHADTPLEHWGPYASQQEAIARRIGLIRAGKCQPI
jgi:hypothetical protein